MKKKATIIVLTAMLIVSFYNEIYSQDHYYFMQQRNLVMASNGLNVRSKPSTKSVKLVNVPYGEKVQILHKDHYGLDTIYTIKTELRDHPVYGYWQKVKYGEYVGYVNNAFLTYNSVYKSELTKGKNEDFVYLRPGYDCTGEFFNTNEYIWYGYYQEKVAEGEPSKKPYRKQITVEFINTADYMTGSGTIVKEDRNLRFIIGSKKIFPEVEMKNIIERKLYNRINQNDVTLDHLVSSEKKITIVENEDLSNSQSFPKFFIVNEKKKQMINTPVEDYYLFINDYFIQADLDGDGINDYIFDLGHDGISRGLFLSSEADENEVAKFVSVYHRGPCC